MCIYMYAYILSNIYNIYIIIDIAVIWFGIEKMAYIK